MKRGAKAVFCKDCARLETKANPKPFCPYLDAFITPELLSQPWQCEGYKEKRKEGALRRKARSRTRVNNEGQMG